MRVNFRRWGVFNLVGFGGFLLQIGAIALLTRAFGWSSVAATAAGLELAAFNNFLGHSRWTWGEHRPASWRAWAARYWRYQLTKTASLALSLAITMALVYLAGFPAEIANLAAVLVCALPNYLVSERFVFHASQAK